MRIALAAWLPVSAACLWAQPWAVSEVRQFGAWGNYSFTAATASGDFYVGSGAPPLSPPTRQYGGVGQWNVFVSKVNAGGAPGFSVEIGGAYRIDAVAADSAGNVYFAGAATLAGLPITAGAYRSTPVGDFNEYVCELKPDGSLAFCTYLDTNQFSITGMAVDAAGNVCMDGTTLGPSAAPTPGAFSQGGSVFVTKLAAGGARLIFAAELGSDPLMPGPIATDSAGNIFLSGTTLSASFLAELNASGTALVNYLDGKAGETPGSLALDGSANVYLTGRESDGSMFVRKYVGGGPAVTYEKIFATSVPNVSPVAGGPRNVPVAIGVDNLGIANVVGYTNSVNFPLHQITQSCDLVSFPGGPNTFLLRLSTQGDLLQSTYLTQGAAGLPLAFAVTAGVGYVATDSDQLAVLTLGPVTGSAATLQFGCIGNAATFGFGIAPGEVVSLFGEGIGPDVGVPYQLDANQRLSTTVAETQVTFDGVAAPLLYVQASQINAIAPWGIAGKTSSQVCITYRGAPTNCIQTAVVGAAPGVFLTNTGYAAALNQDQTVNSPENPAAFGSVASIFVTGMGPVTPVPIDGAVTQLPLHTQNYGVRYMIPRAIPPDVPGEILYAGPAPFEPAGLVQINIRVTAGGGYLQVLLPDGTAISSPLFAIVVTQPAP